MNLRAQEGSKAGPLALYGTPVVSRLFVGTAGYPSPQVLSEAVKASQAEIVTVSLRRETAGGRMGGQFLDLVSALGVKLLPNTAGCRTPRDAIATAEMARELFGTDWVKLGLVEAAKALVSSGFKVFPYTTEDLSVAERLLAAGCQVIMPWGAPIGTGRGLANKQALMTLRAYFPGVPLVVDAGIGAPSHAAEAMELGYDAVLLNTAIAKATDPVGMARAFSIAVKAGRMGYEAGLMNPRDMAVPSTPVAGTPFFDIE